jgi:hypothetical protein
MNVTCPKPGLHRQEYSPLAYRGEQISSDQGRVFRRWFFRSEVNP